MLIKHLGPVRIKSLRNPVIERVPVPRKALAPIVRENGAWTYRVAPPTDFFTLKALTSAWFRYYLNGGPEPSVQLVDR